MRYHSELKHLSTSQRKQCRQYPTPQANEEATNTESYKQGNDCGNGTIDDIQHWLENIPDNCPHPPCSTRTGRPKSVADSDSQIPSASECALQTGGGSITFKPPFNSTPIPLRETRIQKPCHFRQITLQHAGEIASPLIVPGLLGRSNKANYCGTQAPPLQASHASRPKSKHPAFARWDSRKLARKLVGRDLRMRHNLLPPCRCKGRKCS